jgi:hypothetical protein
MPESGAPVLQFFQDVAHEFFGDAERAGVRGQPDRK